MILIGLLVINIHLTGMFYQNLNVHKTGIEEKYARSVCLALLNLILFSTGTMCFIHQNHLRNSFHEGLLSAMSKYSENDTVKVEIDTLQIEFTCCGNEGYEDWFDIQWINSIYLNLDDKRVRSKMTNGKFLNDDVPFSCCNPYSIRPCIHHHVHDDMFHYNYDHRTGLTLHSVGCKESLMGYFSRRLQYLGAIVFLVFLIEMAILCGLRLLQTSIALAEDLGDSEATTMGYLFNFNGTPPYKKKVKDIEDIEEDDSDFLDDSTFDEEDFEEEIDNTQTATGPGYENFPLQGGQQQGHPQNQTNKGAPMDPQGSEGKEKSSPEKSAKDSSGLSRKETKKGSTKDSMKKRSTKRKASPKSSPTKSMKKGKKKLTRSVKKGSSKGKSLKQKGVFRGIKR
ncbi:Peripherin-2 [Holothuria leucospilota]|uniref:Peripherin-2 n=1 Tax=Holothuria leucospilota TaxID=206669 RepID=A0A9Q1CHL5_HOLLE|nr:Peripherin-2 [Holothuria leucospilota]